MLTQQGFEVRHIIGASGGAASAVMVLADPEPASLKVLNDTYTLYGKKCDFSTKCWKDVYQNLLENLPGAFDRVKRFGKVSLVCDGKHLILYNFTDAEQAAQAYAASGGGPFEIKGISKRCGDGGKVKQEFPAEMKSDHLVYFATSSVEGSSGAASFPLWCPPPHSWNFILITGYNCIPYLTDQSQIKPELYSVADDKIGSLGNKATWQDCGL